MIRVYIYCEGQTEEQFIKDILCPFFLRKNISVIPIICSTKRTNIKKYKGGVTTYEKFKSELTKICKSHNNEFVTTMFDYYALPNETPGRQNPVGADIFEKVIFVEQQIANDINCDNFIPNLILHEFEGLLFSDPEGFKAYYSSDERLLRLKRIRDDFLTPEHINDSFETTPSKRIKSIYLDYNKVLGGSIIACEIGIDKIIEECCHFRDWINKINALAH